MDTKVLVAIRSCWDTGKAPGDPIWRGPLEVLMFWG